MVHNINALIAYMYNVISSRKKHGRKRPWLGSAAYLSIIHLKHSKIESIVSISPRDVAPYRIAGNFQGRKLSRNAKTLRWSHNGCGMPRISYRKLSRMAEKTRNS